MTLYICFVSPRGKKNIEGGKVGRKLVVQKGVKGNPKKTIRRRAANKPLREIKKIIKKS